MVYGAGGAKTAGGGVGAGEMGDGAEAAGRWAMARKRRGEWAACAGGLARRRGGSYGRMVKVGVLEKEMARRRGLYMASSWTTGMVKMPGMSARTW